MANAHDARRQDMQKEQMRSDTIYNRHPLFFLGRPFYGINLRYPIGIHCVPIRYLIELGINHTPQ